MISVEVTRPTAFSQSFYASLLGLEEGERFRTCLQCGTCSGVCPFGFAMEFPPGSMIGALRAGQFDWVTDTDSVWLCVSCYACTAGCPALIPLTQGLMTRAKEEMVMAGKVPSELQDALEKSQRYGNPLGESPRKRADWARGLELAPAVMSDIRRPVDVLWFIGDYGCYHPRVQSTTRALARLLGALQVDVGTLGAEEWSDGDSQRLSGEPGLFEMLAEKNGRAFAKYEFGSLMTADAHAYNALRNEYPKLGIEYPVQHHTQFLFDRLEALRPMLRRSLDARVTYHDACYLGRANGVYEPPRALLQAIPGVELVEMTHSGAASLCCGGGGGGMWLDGFQWEKTGVRLSEWRVREALAAGADILAVACPYEAPRFEDAVKTVPGADGLLVRDVAELLVEAMTL